LNGVIESEDRFAAFTVKGALPVEEPNAAEIVVVPTLSAVASPLTVIEAMPLADDFQITTLVMSCVVPSENVPNAVNCCAIPNGMFAFCGETAIAVTVAEVTVSVAEPTIEPDVAEITDCPGDIPLAKPLVGAALLMLDTAVFDDPHVTLPVIF